MSQFYTCVHSLAEDTSNLALGQTAAVLPQPSPPRRTLEEPVPLHVLEILRSRLEHVGAHLPHLAAAALPLHAQRGEPGTMSRFDTTFIIGGRGFLKESPCLKLPLSFGSSL